MKKPVILWIVAALFLLCSIPFFGEGNIGAGVTGIAITAALGVFGYVTMKKAQAAAEAERQKAEAEAKRKAEEEARRKEYAETHEFLTCPVAGVTFGNKLFVNSGDASSDLRGNLHRSNSFAVKRFDLSALIERQIRIPVHFQASFRRFDKKIKQENRYGFLCF